MLKKLSNKSDLYIYPLQNGSHVFRYKFPKRALVKFAPI